MLENLDGEKEILYLNRHVYEYREMDETRVKYDSVDDVYYI